MFLDELTPIVREFAGHPVAFLGGLASGVFRLNLSEDPVRSWLNQQAGAPSTYASSEVYSPNGKGRGPQTIEIE